MTSWPYPESLASVMTSFPKFAAKANVSWPETPLMTSLPFVLTIVSLWVDPISAWPELATTWPTESMDLAV